MTERHEHEAMLLASTAEAVRKLESASEQIEGEQRALHRQGHQLLSGIDTNDSPKAPLNGSLHAIRLFARLQPRSLQSQSAAPHLQDSRWYEALALDSFLRRAKMSPVFYFSRHHLAVGSRSPWPSDDQTARVVISICPYLAQSTPLHVLATILAESQSLPLLDQYYLLRDIVAIASVRAASLRSIGELAALVTPLAMRTNDFRLRLFVTTHGSSVLVRDDDVHRLTLAAIEHYTLGRYREAYAAAAYATASAPHLFESLETLALCIERGNLEQPATVRLPATHERLSIALAQALRRTDVDNANEGHLSVLAFECAPIDLCSAIGALTVRLRLLESGLYENVPTATSAWSTSLTPRSALACRSNTAGEAVLDLCAATGAAPRATDFVSMQMRHPFRPSSTSVAMDGLPRDRKLRWQAHSFEAQGEYQTAAKLWDVVARDSAASVGARNEALLRAVTVSLQSRSVHLDAVARFTRAAVAAPQLVTSMLARQVAETIVAGGYATSAAKLYHWPIVLRWAHRSREGMSPDLLRWDSYLGVVKLLMAAEQRSPRFFLTLTPEAAFPDSPKEEGQLLLAHFLAEVLSIGLLRRFGSDSGESEREQVELRIKIIDKALSFIELRPDLAVPLERERDRLASVVKLLVHKQTRQEPRIRIPLEYFEDWLQRDSGFSSFVRALFVIASQFKESEMSSRNSEVAVAPLFVESMQDIARVVSRDLYEIAASRFLHDPLYGVEVQISFQIRHTTAEALLRAPFAHRLAGRHSNGQVSPNPWLRALATSAELTPDTASALFLASERLSRHVDRALSRLTKSWLHFDYHGEGVEAPFLRVSYDDGIGSRLLSVVTEKPRSQIASEVLTLLRDSTYDGLSKLRAAVSTELAAELAGAIDAFTVAVPSIRRPWREDLAHECERARQETDRAVRRLLEWLTPTPSGTTAFVRRTFAQAVNEAVLRVVGNDFHEFERIQSELSVPKRPWRIPSSSYGPMLGILENLFENAVRHGRLIGAKITARKAGPNVVIRFSNQTPQGVPNATVLGARQLNTQLVAFAKRISVRGLAAEAADDIEGGSGLKKILTLLRYHIGDDEGEVWVRTHDLTWTTAVKVNASLVGYATSAS